METDFICNNVVIFLYKTLKTNFQYCRLKLYNPVDTNDSETDGKGWVTTRPYIMREAFLDMLTCATFNP